MFNSPVVSLGAVFDPLETYPIHDSAIEEEGEGKTKRDPDGIENNETSDRRVVLLSA